LVRSDDGGRTLANESRSRKYVGNSVLAAISNSISNGLNGTVNGAYPAPPDREAVLNRIWNSIATQVPNEQSAPNLRPASIIKSDTFSITVFAFANNAG